MDMMQILFCLVITDVILWGIVLFIGLWETAKSDNSVIEFDAAMVKTLLAIAKALSFLILLVMAFISIRSLAVI
jgi:hypothetical protein